MIKLHEHVDPSKLNLVEAQWFVGKLAAYVMKFELGHALMLTMKEIDSSFYWKIFSTEADCWKYKDNIPLFFKAFNDWLRPKVISINNKVYYNENQHKSYLSKLVRQGFWLQPITRSYDYYHKGGSVKNINLYEDVQVIQQNRLIIYTNTRSKWEYLQNSIIVAHLDNYETEMNLINKHTTTVAISTKNVNWYHKLDKILWETNTLAQRQNIKL